MLRGGSCRINAYGTLTRNCAARFYRAGQYLVGRETQIDDGADASLAMNLEPRVVAFGQRQAEPGTR